MSKPSPPFNSPTCSTAILFVFIVLYILYCICIPVDAAFLVRRKDVLLDSSLHIAGDLTAAHIKASNLHNGPQGPQNGGAHFEFQKQYNEHATLVSLRHSFSSFRRFTDPPSWGALASMDCVASVRHDYFICMSYSLYVYDFKRFKWSTAPNAPQRTYFPSLFILNDSSGEERLLRFSGCDSPTDESVGMADSVYSVQVADAAINALTAKSSPGYTLWKTSVTVYNGTAYMYGGQDDTSTLHSSVLSCDADGNVSELANVGTARLMPALFAHKDFLYVFGGRDGGGSEVTDAFKYGPLSSGSPSYTSLGTDFYTTHSCSFFGPTVLTLVGEKFRLYQMFQSSDGHFCQYTPQDNSWIRISFSNPFNGEFNRGAQYGNSAFFAGSEDTNGFAFLTLM
uniref:Uncharacterized protein n=1 Tax=Percolomonas cosmopolitus TaxID=63605 RepID=A0A7S1KQ89_9EUKA|eukprot:CAMPEP_0117451002 /NCGR_PEP_ID=MMETSP0759-20121206/8773_1 /TAXON_ID=63605 /ORGANISM="Percolomonas cosmopolitus, Strain WS" /LENGTH=395 /DNA_ID=CAMNT_0005243569 /DNA_START=63 /DNA_END=1250 /DNA_ORIENTATION=+